MTEAILGIVASIITVVAMILRARLAKEKTRGEKLAEAADEVGRRAQDLKEKIASGRVYDVVKEMDDLARRCRLLRLR